MNWRQESAGWPNRDVSEFWQVKDTVWHVQRCGAGPKMLLLHGTGASTHSWAGLMQALAGSFEIVAADLPGHGFTQVPGGFRPTLASIADAVSGLLADMEFVPEIIVGHSAGAAIAINMCVRKKADPKLLVSVNGALKPFAGIMQMIAPVAAKAAAFGGVAAWMVSRSPAGEMRVRRLVESIGSDAAKVDIQTYAALLRQPGHIQGALEMMANWDLGAIMEDCGRITCPALFVAGANDKAVPCAVSKNAAGRSPKGVYVELEALGHLAHEEAPQKVADTIMGEWDRAKEGK